MEITLEEAEAYFKTHFTNNKAALELIKRSIPDESLYAELFNAPYADGYAEKMQLLLEFLALSPRSAPAVDVRVTVKLAQEIDPAGQFLGWDTPFFTPSIVPFVGSNLGNDFPYWVYRDGNWWYVGNCMNLFNLTPEQMRAEIAKAQQPTTENPMLIKKRTQQQNEAPEDLQNYLKTASDFAAFETLLNASVISQRDLESVFPAEIAQFLHQYQSQPAADKTLGMLQLKWKTGGILGMRTDQDLKGFEKKLLPGAVVFNVRLMVEGGMSIGNYAGTWAKVGDNWRCFKL